MQGKLEELGLQILLNSDGRKTKFKPHISCYVAEKKGCLR